MTALPAPLANQRYLRRCDAAALLGLAPATLAKWAREGTGPRMVKFGAAACYRLDDLIAFADARIAHHAAPSSTAMTTGEGASNAR
jgi:hypothetical protein